MHKKAKNPVTKYLVSVSVTTFLVAGLCTALDWIELLAQVVIPLSFTCSLLAVLYAYFALRIGTISMVGNLGKIYHYTRKKEPLLFFSLFFLYLILSVPSAIYLASRLIGG